MLAMGKYFESDYYYDDILIAASITALVIQDIRGGRHPIPEIFAVEGQDCNVRFKNCARDLGYWDQDECRNTITCSLRDATQDPCEKNASILALL